MRNAQPKDALDKKSLRYFSQVILVVRKAIESSPL